MHNGKWQKDLKLDGVVQASGEPGEGYGSWKFEAGSHQAGRDGSKV
jgi:hypothetical protein